jgi:predicted transposase YbfD/YdcC
MTATFVNWVAAIAEPLRGQVVAIDGKTVRRSHDRRAGKAAIHLVSAWADAQRLVLGQVCTDAKSNEITAIPELLALLDLHGCIVTIDAIGCQKAIAADIVERGADCVLALKGNHDHLHHDVGLVFDYLRRTDFKDSPSSYFETVDKEHGHIEVPPLDDPLAALDGPRVLRLDGAPELGPGGVRAPPGDTNHRRDPLLPLQPHQ